MKWKNSMSIRAGVGKTVMCFGDSGWRNLETVEIGLEMLRR